MFGALFGGLYGRIPVIRWESFLYMIIRQLHVDIDKQNKIPMSV